MPRQPHDVPTTASAEQGEVMLDGPDGIAASMTPDAAKKSARAIDLAADEAHRQVDGQDAAQFREDRPDH